jgi:hypothetical protein
LPPKECAGENYARCQSIQSESLLAPADFSRRSKSSEFSEAFAAGAEMTNPGIKVRDGNLMASQALQKLRVRTADSIWIRESLCQLFIEEL